MVYVVWELQIFLLNTPHKFSPSAAPHSSVHASRISLLNGLKFSPWQLIVPLCSSWRASSRNDLGSTSCKWLSLLSELSKFLYSTPLFTYSWSQSCNNVLTSKFTCKLISFWLFPASLDLSSSPRLVFFIEICRISSGIHPCRLLCVCSTEPVAICPAILYWKAEIMQVLLWGIEAVGYLRVSIGFNYC